MHPKKKYFENTNYKLAIIIDNNEIFTLLMGDEVEPRKKFIEENANKVTNLDV